MKTLILTFLLPFTLNAVCRDCDFPYRKYIRTYRQNYEYVTPYLIVPEDLKTEREISIFYSGAVFGLERIMIAEEEY